MILGNSRGNNSGKRYLKITGNEVVTVEGQLRYNLFSSWFSLNYLEIEHQLVLKSVLDHEVLNNTFIKISNIMLYHSIDISDYMAYFMRSYYTNLMSESFIKVTN